jgi:translation initiation factor IF-3
MPTPDALKLADENGVDLVEVSPNATPPVCRLMDYGKFKYEQAKKDREARKSQKSSSLRQVSMRTRIGEHDIQLKTRKIRELLGKGDKVKVSVLFRGRELSYPQIGNNLLGKVARSLMEDARVEAPPKMEGRMLSMVLVSTKKVAEKVIEDGSPNIGVKEPVDAKAQDS